MPRNRPIHIINRENFEQAFKKYYSELCRYCISFVKEPELAKGIVQEVFIDLWKRRRRINITHSLKSYLMRAVKNRSIDYLRSNYAKLNFEHEKVLLQYSSTDNPGEQLEYKELKQIVDSALDTLPPKCYAVFSLSRFGNLSNKEIAAKLNISVKTVEGQMTIALKRIYSYIDKF